MSLSQSFYQKLALKLTPQQVQLMKLLTVPTANLEEYITKEMEENPALEAGDDEEEITEDLKDEFETNENEEEILDGSDDEYENIDISEYVSDDDDELPAYKEQFESVPEIEDKQVMPVRVENSSFDVLSDQLGLLNLDERQYKIAEQIIGTLDDDGYLRRDILALSDDLAFRQGIDTNEKEVLSILKQIQTFEPAGIAARNLQECLLIQLKRLNHEDSHKLAIKIIDKYFEEFSRKHYDKITRILNISDEELKEVIQQVIRLNPKPGNNLIPINKAESYIIPDFYAVSNNGVIELTLNGINVPDLRVSEGYKNMLTDYRKGSKNDKQQKEAVLFIKQKLDSAKWFIEMIKQRQHTLISTMQEIIAFQKEYFLTGDENELKPMILKDIADKTGLDISTISRVVNSKYVQTEYGTLPLKFFFNDKAINADGEEISNREIKNYLIEVISKEDKKNPISDEALAEMLSKKGYNVARRTVSKYREILNIPVARLRREL